jgi:hypothetical protein
MDKSWVIIGLLLCIVVLVYFRRRESFGQQIPHTIWTYWDTEEIPDMVQKCMATWKKNNPEWEVVLLTKDNLKKYLPNIDIFKLKFADTPARTSDFIRLHILAQYGGVWSDATSIIPKPLDWIDGILNQNPECEYMGYYKEGNTTRPEFKSIESWFFACTPWSNFVSKWRDEFTRMNDFNSIGDYVDSIKAEGVDLQNIGDYEYLTIYVSCQRVLQKQMGPEQIKNKIHLFKLEDDQKHMGGDMKELCTTDTIPPVIKFTRFERNIIDTDRRLECIFERFK